MTAMPEDQQIFDSSLSHNDGKFHLLLCASGSVATIKIPNIIQALSKHSNLLIRLILTESAAKFLQGQSSEQPSLTEIASYPNVEAIHLDHEEWAVPWTRGAKILHIELRRWADLMVVAPLSANTLAKMVGGLCDNMLLETMRAWDTTGELSVPRQVPSASASNKVWSVAKKAIMVAPAMNTAMWVHPTTKAQMKVLEGEWALGNGGWIQVLRPIEKELACGDVGGGAMMPWTEIVTAIEDYFELDWHH